MSLTLSQIYAINPAASLLPTDLIYLDRSLTDYGIQASDLATSIFPTVVVITASAQMNTNTRYIANRASLVSLSLPLTSSVGDTITIAGMGIGGWSIIQAAGQQIFISPDVSTLGVAGSVSSAAQYDSLVLQCLVSNMKWTALGGPQSSGLIII